MSPHFSWDQVGEGLFVGSCPQSPDDIRYLKDDLGVTAVINLQSDEDLAQRAINWQAYWTVYVQSGIKVKRVPVTDFAKEDLLRQLDVAVEALKAFLDEGRTVFVHCNVGINRSPTLALAYYASHGGMSLEEATNFVKERRRSIPYPDVVEAWLRKRSNP